MQYKKRFFSLSSIPSWYVGLNLFLNFQVAAFLGFFHDDKLLNGFLSLDEW